MSSSFSLHQSETNIAKIMIASGDESMLQYSDDNNTNMHRPTLNRRNAVRLYHRKLISKNYSPSHLLTKQYARYSYIRYSKIVIKGYICNYWKQYVYDVQSVSTNIADLCIKYYYIKEDAMYQLGFEIYSVLNKLNKHCITIELLKLIIRKYLRLKKHSKKISFYCNELIRLQYIVPLKVPKKK
eukprot:542094_1